MLGKWTTLPNDVEIWWRIIRNACCFTNSLQVCEDRDSPGRPLTQGVSPPASRTPLAHVGRSTFAHWTNFANNIVQSHYSNNYICTYIFMRWLEASPRSSKGPEVPPNHQKHVQHLFLDMETQDSEWSGSDSLLGMFPLRTQRSVISGLLCFLALISS